MDIDIFIDDFCKCNNLDLDKLKSNHRKTPYQDYRRILIFILHNTYELKLNEIAIILNKKNHTVIWHSLRRHSDYMKFDKQYRKRYLDLI